MKNVPVSVSELASVDREVTYTCLKFKLEPDMSIVALPLEKRDTKIYMYI